MTDVDLTRALSFGAIAEQYERTRPSYPAELVDDLVALHPQSVLDVGAGTGKVSQLLLARGLDVLAIEPDPRMAALARRKGITVEESAFEHWDPRGRRFDLIVAGQSWHWVPQPDGSRRACDILRDNGHLAAFWNLGVIEPPAAAAIDAVYAETAPTMARGDQGLREHMEDQRRHLESLREVGFVRIELRTYPWAITYTADEWVALIATHSDHVTLAPEVRTTLLTRVHDAIVSVGGSLVLELSTALILAARP